MTPSAGDFSQREYQVSNGKRVLVLPGQAKMWATPNARDCKGKPPPKGFISLTKDADTHGLRSVATTTDGDNGSPKVDLNPFFVATLMGLPMDWLTLSTSEVTDWCRKQLHTPSDPCSSAHDGN